MLAGCCLGAFAQNAYDDDIYYDPKRDTPNKQTKRNSNYIRNMADMDVDAYNRRGQYYPTPVDTIGEATGNAEDFVYTQQIQKYYNPTIVVDNADLLGDILANSYGNVDVVINNAGVPVFAPWSYSPYYYNWPYYGGWNISFGNPWFSFNWNWGPSWAWGPSWTWGPAWNWGWGPSWAWGPSWGWGPGWGPGWDWRPGWGPGWGGRPGPRPDYRPHGNRPAGPGGGWASNTRPGYNYNGASNGRPHRVQGSNGVVKNPDGKWEYARPSTNTHRGYGQGAVGSRNDNAGHRVSGWGLGNSQDRTLQQTSGAANRGSGVSNRNTNTHRQTGVSNNNTNTNTNRNSYNTNRNTSRQQNRSYNNTSRSGYGSGGSHRSGGGSRGGGGGSRGRHR